MVDKLVSSKVIEDAREKIAFLLFMSHKTSYDSDFIYIRSVKTWAKYKHNPSLAHYWNEADTILALSGTTDIEYPDEATGDPDFACIEICHRLHLLTFTASLFC